MHSPSPHAQREVEPEHGVLSNHTVEELLRQILKHVGEEHMRGNQLQSGPDGPEVVFDVRIDGTCYTLLRSPGPPAQSQVTLSPREREIVRLVAKGLPSKVIAEVLDVSLWTVATHLRRVFAKLGVNSRAEMVAHVLKDGLLAADERRTIAPMPASPHPTECASPLGRPFY